MTQVCEVKKMKAFHRYPFTPSSCHCSGVTRSDSKLSAKALYGKKLPELLTHNSLGGSILFNLIPKLLCIDVIFLKSN